MYELTERERIKETPNSWKRVYYNRSKEWYNQDKKEIYDKLSKLDLNTCYKEDVDHIIGNSSWTDNNCDVCSKHRYTVLKIDKRGDEFSICSKCLKACLSMLE